MALAYARFADEHRAEFDVMFTALIESGGAAEGGGGRNLAILETAIREAQQNGEVRQGDAAVLARVVEAVIHGASVLRLDEHSPDFVRLSTEVLRSGLASRPAPAVPRRPPIKALQSRADMHRSVLDLRCRGFRTFPCAFVVSNTSYTRKKASMTATRLGRIAD